MPIVLSQVRLKQLLIFKILKKKLYATLYIKISNNFKSHLFRVFHKEPVTEWKNISGGIPQRSVLGPFMYLLDTGATLYG